MPKIFAFSGFLGSGKTTIVLGLTKYFLQKNKRIIIIVNDMGDIGVDSKVLEKTGSDVHEIVSGCICSHIGYIAPILQGLGSKYEADYVFIEATGLGQPHNFIPKIKAVAQNLSDIKDINVVDAVRWFKLKQVVGDVVTNQLQAADIVIINKISDVSKEQLSKVLEDVKELSPRALVLSVDAKVKEDIEKIAGVIEND